MIVAIKVKQTNVLTIEASDEVSSGKIASDIIYFLLAMKKSYHI